MRPAGRWELGIGSWVLDFGYWPLAVNYWLWVTPVPLRPACGHVRLGGRHGKHAAGDGGAICTGTVHCGGKGSDFFDFRFAICDLRFTFYVLRFVILYHCP